jgi:hypothetical protein
LGEIKPRRFGAQVRGLPGVREVGGIDDLPLGNEFRQASRFVIEGQPIPAVGVRPIAQTRTVSLGYFFSLAIPLRAGRTFNEDDWKVLNMVINENMARRYWPQGTLEVGHFCSLTQNRAGFNHRHRGQRAPVWAGRRTDL